MVDNDFLRWDSTRFEKDFELYEKYYSTESDSISPNAEIPYEPGCCESSVPILRFMYS